MNSATDLNPLHVRHIPWQSELRLPAMSNTEDPGGRVTVTNRYLVREGVPVIPVSGEFHFSRVPRGQWNERLRLMKAGGVGIVAFYVFWVHHEPEPGEYRFEGDLDLRAFIEACAAAGLDVVVRIGPWVHGESRNGGFPDWVQRAPIRHRTDDPAYLELVAEWYRRIGVELDGLCGSDGPIIGVQLENELYDQPDHIVTLKALARNAGIHAPIWTATAWGGAQLPEGEVLPLYGGYGDGFWVDYDAPWDSTFREHFFFRHVWDDPGIGADVRAGYSTGNAFVSRSASPNFPPATCELGGGMARAYHRRPDVGGLDVAAVSLCKIGNGSAWQGFYMFVGGRNPAPGVQESHETGYPNDLPIFDYDFNAPIGSSGRVGPSFAALRRQNSFLAAFGDRLARMPSTLPDARPNDVFDSTTPRWALRSDGHEGFVFVNRHQPIEQLDDDEMLQFSIGLDEETIIVPADPIRIPRGTLAHWPVNLAVADVVLRWATASAFTVLRGGGRTTLVLIAEEGIAPQIAFPAETAILEAPDDAAVGNGIVTLGPSTARLTLRARQSELDVLVLSPEHGRRAWALGDGSDRRLVFASEEMWVDESGALAGRSSDDQIDVQEYNPALRTIASVPITVQSGASESPLDFSEIRSWGLIPPSYGQSQGRASAPSERERDDLAQLLRITPPTAGWDAGGELVVDWSGDVVGLLVDGVRRADQYWAGQPLIVDLSDMPIRADSVVDIELLPLHRDARVGLPASARRRQDQNTLLHGGISSIQFVQRGHWSEESVHPVDVDPTAPAPE